MTQIPNSEILENFCKEYLKPKEDGLIRIYLQDIERIKEQGISLENLLAYIHSETGMLMHGSISQITNGTINSDQRRIFATNAPIIAILKSIFSNKNTNLRYSRNVPPVQQFSFEIHPNKGREYISVNHGYIYLVAPEGFQPALDSNYEFITDLSSVKILGIIETARSDFTQEFKVVESINA